MPFKSEKQRRYLWLKHPDIAKRWADTYPTKKDLPMYADDTKATEKQSTAAQILNGVLPNYLRKFATSGVTRVYDANIKKSDSKQEYVKLPVKQGPTFAGESEAQAVSTPVKDGLNDNNAPSPEKQDQVTADTLFKKLAVVLSPVLMQEIENEQAMQQAREAQRMPKNVGIKPTPPTVNSILPPMGMAQPAPNPGQTQSAQPQQPQQPANGQLASVGGGASPNANPINSFGGLSSTGDINGNAALGTQNMAGGEKMATGSDALAWLMSIDNCNLPDPEDLDYDERAKIATEKWSAVGLWDRIRAKRKRGGKPAKPGGKDYPDAKSWEKVTNISEKKSYSAMDFGDILGGMEHGSRGANNLHSEAMTYGAGLGGVAGLLHEYMRDKSPAEKEQPMWRKTLRYAGKGGVGALAGTGVGAIVGNVSSNDVTNRWQNLKNENYQKAHDNLSSLGKELGWDESELTAPNTFSQENAAAINDIYRQLTEKRNSSKQAASSPAWQRSAGKNDEGGLNAKGRASYNKATGGNLKAPVTESKPKGKRAKRQNSFCSRMCGMKKHETGAKTKSDPESRINKALRKWNCKCANCAGQPFDVAKSASLERMLTSALVSAGGGLALGAYPGWHLQQASARAGNPEFVNSFVGRIPIAAAGALSGGLYNYLREQQDAEAKKKLTVPAAN